MNALRSVSLLFLLTVSVAAHAQNLVTNGSFETGTFAGWTVTNPDPFLKVFTDVPANRTDGNYAAFFGTYDTTSSISQTLGTVAGQDYLLTFDLRAGVANSAGNTPSSFAASFGGATLLSLIDPPNSGGFVSYTFRVVGSGADSLTFAGRNDPNYYVLDNVRLVAVPGPLATLPFALLALRRRKRA